MCTWEYSDLSLQKVKDFYFSSIISATLNRTSLWHVNGQAYHLSGMYWRWSLTAMTANRLVMLNIETSKETVEEILLLPTQEVWHMGHGKEVWHMESCWDNTMTTNLRCDGGLWLSYCRTTRQACLLGDRLWDNTTRQKRVRSTQNQATIIPASTAMQLTECVKDIKNIQYAGSFNFILCWILNTNWQWIWFTTCLTSLAQQQKFWTISTGRLVKRILGTWTQSPNNL